MPGRDYEKVHVPKGQSKKRIQYTRECRDAEGVPESRAQILKFIREQNKELQNFIEETDETAKVENSLDYEDMLAEHLPLVFTTGDVDIDDSVFDSDEELLEAGELEI